MNSIGLDHVQALGNTIEKITEKKVGIFKPNTPALIGPNVPIQIAKVIFNR
jgi:folylpolyglutamate synthase/dihydropteroate synthase